MKLIRCLAVVMLLVQAVLAWTAMAGDQATKPLVIDVRTEPEWHEGHLEGAILIPYEKIGEEIARVAPDKNTKVLLYCRSGRRSGIGLDTLKKLGYGDVTNLGSVNDASEKLQIRIVK